ncbi:MAG: TorD/DmsD family molecular chaperone [Halanaeroarchaeum sp.]
MSTTEIDREFARARSRVYDLLSRVFDGDVEALSEAIETGAFVDLAATLPADFDTDALSRDDLDVEALSIGYDNLFDVPGPYYVPPFASAHADDPSESFESDSRYHDAGSAGELLGDPAESIAERYERTGFRPQRGGGIPDHIAAEFEFVAVLAAREARPDSAPPQANDEDLPSVQAQVVDHLEWVDAFAEAVAERDSAEGVYAALCSFASAFVAWDQLQVTQPSV